MKLLNKILISGFSTLTTAGCLIPLVSCNDAKMSKEDWNKAFASIANPYDETRDFTITGTIPLFGTLSVKCKGTLNDGHWISTTEQDDNYLSCIHNDVLWEKTTDTLRPFYTSNLPCLDMLGTFYSIGQGFLESYEDAEFKDATHCEFDWSYTLQEELTLKIHFNFEFDAQKRISKVVAEAKQEDGTTFATATLNFTDYGTTQIGWTIDEKFDFTNREITATRTGNEFSGSKTDTRENDAYLFNMPDDLELTDLKYIKISGGDVYTNRYEVILNGKILTKGTDYTDNADQGGTNITKVTLKNAVQKGDKLRFVFNPQGSGTLNPTVTLTATE